MSTAALRRNETKLKPSERVANLKLAVALSQTQADKLRKDYNYPIKVPHIMPNVVPAGQTAPIAMDANLFDYGMMGISSAGGGFPGFPYLAQLATRSEYRAMAEAMSTELTREWIELTSKQDDDNSTADKIKVIEEELENLKVRETVQLAASHDCYFGRAQVFFDIEGQDRKTPLILDPRTVPLGSLKRITAVEAIWTTPSMYNALDPAAADFYKPSSWFMLGQQVHASRLHTVITRPVPDILKPSFNFAGMSLSQLAEPYVDNWLRTRQSISDLINNFSITALKTSMDQILQGSDDGAGILDRAKLFTAHRSNQGLMLLDMEHEELVQTNTPLSGLHELQSQAQEQMCSVSRMPAIILTGVSPQGLNASSDGEIRVFYDWIAAQQTAFWGDLINTIIKLIQLSKFGEIDPNIGYRFVPLYQMTPKELAEIRQLDSTTDANYVNAAVLDPAEVRDKLAKDPDSGYDGLDTSIVPVKPIEPTGEEDPLAGDASVSEKQHRAMEAAAHGNSTLGIPESVGKEFVSKDD